MNKNISILSTKLKMPQPRADYITRKELNMKLEKLCDYQLALVKGNAGSGKTTLVTSFFKEHPNIPVKWLSLNGINNEVINFWHYFIEAISKDLDEDVQDLKSFFDVVFTNDDVIALINVVINKMSVLSDIFIVLDDFQVIKNKYILDNIEYLLKNLSDNVHIIIITRDEPELYLGDIFIDGRLLIINEEDLNFSEQESREFICDTLKLTISDELQERIFKISEGWVGGLQMIALTVKTNGDETINNLQYLNRHTVDYLSKEILDTLSEEERFFLIKTSILPYFNESICNELLDTDNAGQIINSLYEKHLFINRIDGEDGYFRYHNLFSEFLLNRFSTLNSNERKLIREKAGDIYCNMADYDEAVSQYTAAESYVSIINVIKSLEQGYKVWNYLSYLPLDTYKYDVDLVFQRLFFLYCTNEFDKLKGIFDFLDFAWEKKNEQKMLSAFRSILVDWEINTDIATIEDIDSIPINATTRAILYVKSAAFLYMKYRFKDSLAYAAKAEEIEKSLNNPAISLIILGVKSGSYEELGELKECEKIYDEAFNLLDKYKFLKSYSMNLYVGLTGVYLKCGKLENAEETLEKSLKCSGNVNMYFDAGYIYNLMELKLMRGGSEEAAQLLARLMDMEIYKKILFASSIVRFLIVLNKLDDDFCSNYLKMYDECDEKYIRIEDKLAYAKIQYYKGNIEKSLTFLDSILIQTRAGKIRIRLVEALLFKIKILSESSQKALKDILDLFREAIYYSYENNIVYPFIIEGKGLLIYLEKLRIERIHDLNSGEKQFFNNLIKMIKVLEVQNINNQETKTSILSERELEVLRELLKGSTNKEIGECLCISLATVKTHIVNIYSKLHVKTRLEVANKVKELSLLEFR